MALLGTPFEVIAPEFDEKITARRPIEDEVLQFAVGKAQSVAIKNPDSLVIGSDTMIHLDGEKIGKPQDAGDARRILTMLSGKTHEIYTSVAIIDRAAGEGLRVIERVLVTMRALSPQKIDSYLAEGESLDKAGAYSIQGRGRSLIAALAGDYLAAVGMPLIPIADYLRERGVKLPNDISRLYISNNLPIA